MQQLYVSRFRGILAFVLCLLANLLAAQTSPTLSIQGVIKNADGSAVDNGKYPLTFKLYEVETGGTALWTEEQTNVQVTGGVYSILLGQKKALTVGFDKPYYLGITVNSGAELSPRLQLTSSPYALSLIGQSNKFPSTGAVGAGTNAPTAGYQLHVKNDAGEGKILLEGSGNSTIEMKKGSSSAQINYDGSQISIPGTLQVGTLTPTTLNYTPSNWTVTNALAANNATFTSYAAAGDVTKEHTVLNGNQLYALNATKASILYLNNAGGDVHIASGKVQVTNDKTTIANHLEVSGSQSNFGWKDGYMLLENRDRVIGFNAYDVNGVREFNEAVAINATNGAIRSSRGFVASSDRRIKKDIRTSEAPADLAALRNLRVADYRHIDRVSNGDAFKKGFIAQEVGEVFPEAISQSPDFVPNVYALASGFELGGGTLSVALDKKHDFAPGDEVKLISPDGEKTLAVAAVPSETTFSVRWAGAKPENIFVFGKKVNDFNSVDYDRIFTLNVSATQELARQVEALKKENAALKSELKASSDKFEARLRALEGRASN